MTNATGAEEGLEHALRHLLPADRSAPALQDLVLPRIGEELSPPVRVDLPDLAVQGGGDLERRLQRLDAVSRRRLAVLPSGKDRARGVVQPKNAVRIRLRRPMPITMQQRERMLPLMAVVLAPLLSVEVRKDVPDLDQALSHLIVRQRTSFLPEDALEMPQSDAVTLPGILDDVPVRVRQRRALRPPFRIELRRLAGPSTLGRQLLHSPDAHAVPSSRFAEGRHACQDLPADDQDPRVRRPRHVIGISIAK